MPNPPVGKTVGKKFANARERFRVGDHLLGEPGRKSEGDDAFRKAHEFSDLDNDRDSQHHTLGIGPGQAAPGDTTDKSLKDLTLLLADANSLISDLQNELGLYAIAGMRWDNNTARTITKNPTFTKMALNTYAHHHASLLWDAAGVGWKVPVDGKWQVTNSVRFAVDTTGGRLVAIGLNGVQLETSYTGAPANTGTNVSPTVMVSSIIQANANDIINCLAAHTATPATIASIASTDKFTFSSIRYAGPKD